jgi:hypothetical protein
MNTNQKHLYPSTPPMAPVFGAADGNPNHISFHKLAWLVKLGKIELVNLCPWIYVELHRVDASCQANPPF